MLTRPKKNNSIIYLGPQYARFSPKFYYWFFIPCDILSLVLQSIGGALSSDSSGSNNTAVDVSVAGLSFQVFTRGIIIGARANRPTLAAASRSSSSSSPLPSY